MEGLTKGLEIGLPDGHSFFDDAGVERVDVRARWWRRLGRLSRAGRPTCIVSIEDDRTS